MAVKVSVIIPAWGQTPLLQKAVNSVKAQTYSEIELIVAAPFSSGLQTLPSARRAGIERATGEWITFWDADDWIEPDAIAEMINVATQEDADCVCCGMVRDRQDGVSVFRPFDKLGPSDTYNAVVNKLFKRNLLEDLKMDEAVAIGEDLMVSAQAMARAKKIAVLEKGFYHYCENSSSMTHVCDGRMRVENLARVGEILRETMPEPKYAAFHDRVTRDALLLWIRYRLFDRKLWRMLRSRMTGGLLSDSRHGIVKKGALACAACLFD
jgi:glycosyltransferase involved in cell wall biosynthesis